MYIYEHPTKITELTKTTKPTYTDEVAGGKSYAYNVTVIDNTDCGDAKPPDQGSTIPPQSDTNDRSRVQYTITAQ